MYKYKNFDDTIAAISTPSGIGGIGIVRLSGKEAVAITDKVYFSAKGKLSKFPTHTVHWGNIVDKGKGGENIIDEVLVTIMRAPRSYTKENVVEISCHGGTAVLRSILNLIVRNGARLAEPGEFTKRAFLNGRIDLTQAEAVLDIIQAKSDAFLRLSNNQLKGELAQEIDALREKLLSAYTDIEAFVNFPEEEIDKKQKTQIAKEIKDVKSRIEELLATSRQGQLLKEGVRIVICGKPNVGKSSLLNVLLRHQRAIVSDIPGTTRDIIEETAQIKGIPFQIIDTAGILNPRNAVEREAIKRSHLNIESADLLLAMFDINGKLTKEDENIIKKVRGKNFLIVLNKCDLPVKFNLSKIEEIFGKDKIVKISALKKSNISQLQNKIVSLVLQGEEIDSHKVYVSNLRHVESLQKSDNAVNQALVALEGEMPLEFVSEEIKAAVNYLDNITGRNIDIDLLDNIFSRFCIGK